MVSDAQELAGRTPEELRALDRAHVWHPFTHMEHYTDPATTTPMIVRGEGVKVQDTEGNWYDDGTSSIWLNVHGHHIPQLDQALRDQLECISHSTLLGLSNVPSTLLAERLVQIAPPGLQRVFFTDNGAGAVEAALKIAIQHFANIGQERPFVLGFHNNYHGDTLGAVGVAADELFHAPFLGLLPDHPRVPYPATFRHPHPERALDESLDAVDRTLAKRSDIAAVIVEPVEGAAGIIPSPRGFLAGLRERCDRYGVLLIVDEVATGFARTGTMFACEPEGITPDILCLGKGITGGYLPVAATMTTDAVFETFLGEPTRTFFHGHSYTGNPLGCAVALANLDLLEPLIAELPTKIAQLAVDLAPLRSHSFVGDLRHAGFMIGIELVQDAELHPFPYEAQAGWLVANAARERGLLVRPIGNTVIFVPMPGAPAEDLHRMATTLVAAFDDAELSLKELATR